jgi:Uma2 family endonuclease
MDHALSHARMTEGEFMSLPASHDHLELIDGEVVYMPPPVVLHQVIIGNLYLPLRNWATSHPPAWVGLSPCGLRLREGRIVLPDLLVLRAGLPALGRLVTVAPDVTVEVMSERRSYDRITKRLLYHEAGVREYWIVDPDERAVELVAGLQTLEVARERLASRVLPGFTLDVPTLFRAEG